MLNQGLAVATLVMVAAAACARIAPVPSPDYWLSSDSSQYSPTVRLRVATVRDGGSLTVLLDSGVVAVPGTFSGQGPVMIRSLYVTAYVAASNSEPMGLVRDDHGRFADRRGWRAVAESDSILIADSMRFGERLAVSPIRLRLNNVPAGDDGRWLVLGLSGQTVDLRIAFDERSGLRAGAPGARRLQVYACSDRELTGRVDTLRSRAMRSAYGLLC